MMVHASQQHARGKCDNRNKQEPTIRKLLRAESRSRLSQGGS